MILPALGPVLAGALMFAGPPSGGGTVATQASAKPSTAAAVATPAASGLRRWLTRELPAGAHFLDHGVLQVAVAGGQPHRYRAELSLGLFDHLSLGVTARWLPQESAPRWSPRVALAVYRARWWAFGFRYAQVLHRPPAATSFDPRSHYIFGSLAFSQNNFTGGFDAGAVHTRAASLDPDAQATSYRDRFLPAGGLFLRYGTRRWGVRVQGEMPVYALELALDLRFGLFEMRPRGGWRP